RQAQSARSFGHRALNHWRWSHFFRSFRHPWEGESSRFDPNGFAAPTRRQVMNMQATAQAIAAPRPALSHTERYQMSAAADRTASAPRWMLWTGWFLSFGAVAQLLSSAWFRA